MSKKIGILGGGQLAMMLVEAARRLGITDVTVLDPNPNCPASMVGAKQIVGSFLDKLKILELAKQVDTLTIDIENVDDVALSNMINICDIYTYPYHLFDISYHLLNFFLTFHILFLTFF